MRVKIVEGDGGTTMKDLKKIFVEVLNIPEEEVCDNLAYNTISQWNSIAHMSLVAAVDDAFAITMDTADIIDMSSFGKAKEILKDKYGVTTC